MQRIAGRALLLVLLQAGATAQASEFDARRAEARSALRQSIEGYSDWCRDEQLFLERKKALELLLELDPEHAEAHKALGHVRTKAGAWQPPDKPKTFRDFDQKALAEA